MKEEQSSSSCNNNKLDARSEKNVDEGYIHPYIYSVFIHVNTIIRTFFFNTAFQDTATIQSNLMLTWNVSNA